MENARAIKISSQKTRHWSLYPIVYEKKSAPVAMMSSTTTTVCPGWMAPACISNSSCADKKKEKKNQPPRKSSLPQRKQTNERECTRTVPYSFSYEAHTRSPGSFPRLRTGTKAAPSLSAITGPNRKPRASSPTITSIFLLGEVGVVVDTMRWVRWVITTSKVNGLRKSGKMSQKDTP